MYLFIHISSFYEKNLILVEAAFGKKCLIEYRAKYKTFNRVI